MKKDTKETLKIITIVSVIVLAVTAIVLQGLSLKSNHEAVHIGRFISSLFVFTAAIFLAVKSRELVALSVVMFSETVPNVVSFITKSYRNSLVTNKFGDVIKNYPYGFASLFIFIYLMIILALVLRFKAFTKTNRETRKWSFVPPVLLSLFVIAFVAVPFKPSTDGLADIMQVISVIFAVMYISYISAAILSVGMLVLVPFHIGQFAKNELISHHGYVITYWTVGLLYLILAISWLVYEVVYFIKDNHRS